MHFGKKNAFKTKKQEIISIFASTEKICSLLKANTNNMKRHYLLTLFALTTTTVATLAQPPISGALQSFNEDSRGKTRTQQYRPEDGGFVCINGTNRFTRALYGSHTDWRLETSDRPVFAVVKKGHHRNIRFVVNGVPLDSTDYCKSTYKNGMRNYVLNDSRWGKGIIHADVAALPNDEGAVWRITTEGTDPSPLNVKVKICQIANPKLKRNGDIGADKPGIFEHDPREKGLIVSDGLYDDDRHSVAYVVVKLDSFVTMTPIEARQLYDSAVKHHRSLGERIQFSTPDPYINALASALVMAADGDWDGKTWLHGCIGWRMPLAGWRAAYAGDVLGWNDRSVSHFDAYAKSQVTTVEPVIPHPTQDPKMQMARAEKKWGTQMYSNGYICRNPEKDNQMHHYDMNLNYIDELLWHFQYDADTAYMRKMWPVITSHLTWEKRNYDSDGDHLYDAYCCIWASDALYYSGGAVTHSSAYNYRGNKLAARIAELLGEDPAPYHEEAEAILRAMNKRLWMNSQGVWAEYQDGMGLKRLHRSPAVWSIYTPIDCGASSPEQAWAATGWIDENLPHIDVEETGLQTISTSNWMPYSWSINNVAIAEVWHTALAFFEAGRTEQGYQLMMANIMDNMYYGQSPANFGQLSHYDAARGECYRDFGDCVGIASRTLVQGLFGVIPQALYAKCILQPNFPAEWDSVTLKTPYIKYRYTKSGGKCRFEIEQHFAQPLKMVVRRSIGGGRFVETEGTAEAYQVIETDVQEQENAGQRRHERTEPQISKLGLSEPDLTAPFRQVNIDKFFNAMVDNIFKNEYRTPRPQVTTLQIPIQGVSEWCHPQYTPTINDSVFRSLISDNQFTVAGVTFRTPSEGRNIVFTSLWDNYPDSIVVQLKGQAASAYLLMAGSTNHMQSRIDNGLVMVTYQDETSDTLRLRNPDNWCPIEQDYFVDGKAFTTTMPRPYRICLGTGTVSRDLGKALDIKGVYGREIPGGSAQMLRMPLNRQKKLKSLTVQTLSNDVVIGLMGITLQ